MLISKKSYDWVCPQVTEIEKRSTRLNWLKRFQTLDFFIDIKGYGGSCWLNQSLNWSWIIYNTAVAALNQFNIVLVNMSPIEALLEFSNPRFSSTKRILRRARRVGLSKGRKCSNAINICIQAVNVFISTHDQAMTSENSEVRLLLGFENACIHNWTTGEEWSFEFNISVLITAQHMWIYN